MTENGVMIRPVLSLLRSLSRKHLLPQQKTGVNPRKGAVYGRKRNFPLPVTGKESDPGASVSGGRQPKSHCFYRESCGLLSDYLSANDAGLFLPTSIKSYLDGRLGQLEERLSSIAFRQTVEQDMVAGILADAYQFSDEDLRRRRSESVQNVRKTNGRISLEQRARGAWEEDDEWQD